METRESATKRIVNVAGEVGRRMLTLHRDIDMTGAKMRWVGVNLTRYSAVQCSASPRPTGGIGDELLNNINAYQIRC